MKNKAYRIISIAFLAVMLVLSGCAKLSQVSVTSFTLDSVNPKGLRSLSLTASVGVHNPASEITLSEISGEVIISGKVIGNVAMAPVILAARTDSSYTVKADVSLADGVSVMDVLALAGQKSRIEAATVNIYAKAKVKGGPVRKFKIEHMPVKKLLELLKR